MDVRTERREVQRRQVVDVAFDLFLERGYGETTVEEIADAAGISTRTFYRYFEAKDGVLADLGSNMIGETLERIEATGQLLSVDGLSRILAAVFDEASANRRRELMSRLLRERPELQERAGRWREQWASELASGLARLDDRTDPTFDEHVVSRLTIAIVAVSVDRWVQDPSAHGSIGATVDAALRIVREQLA